MRSLLFRTIANFMFIPLGWVFLSLKQTAQSPNLQRFFFMMMSLVFVSACQEQPAKVKIAFEASIFLVTAADGNFDFFADSNINNICVMNVDGSNVINLTRSPADDSSPSWSPDGGKIAFVFIRNDIRYDNNGEICVMDADGSNVINLTRSPADDSEPSWSPDGGKIAFTSEGGIHVMNADGTNHVRFISKVTVDTSPTCSPAPLGSKRWRLNSKR